MASQQEILREYLISLGFKIDKQGGADFTKTIESTERTVKNLGKALAVAAAAIAGMVASFSTSMERLYYASQRANSTASNLKALEFAGRQIGLTAEAVDQMVGGLVTTMTLNPGMKGWFKSMGVDASDARQGVDIWMDFMTKLHEMPPYQGAQFAEMIGMSPDQFLQVERNFGRFKESIGKGLQLQRASGLDTNAAAEEGMRLANLMGVASEQMGIWVDTLVHQFLPDVVKLTSKLDRLITMLDGILGWVLGKSDEVKQNGVVGTLSKMEGGGTGKEQDTKVWHPEEHGVFARTAHGLIAGLMNSGTPWKPSNAAETMYFLEEKYRLPHGTMDYIWNKETSRSKGSMVSPAGAEGPFQFMPSTAEQYGVKDPFNFGQSAEGAAHYLSDLFKKYGNLEDAARAYNWGPQNMDRYLGAKAAGKNPTMPEETRNYPTGLLTRPITININESRSPAVTAKAVRDALADTAADEQRYLLGNSR